MTAERPRLIYDGDCTFCGYWARYWNALTGERVEYLPYQQVAAQYPAIATAEFQRTVQYIAPNGRVASGGAKHWPLAGPRPRSVHRHNASVQESVPA